MSTATPFVHLQQALTLFHNTPEDRVLRVRTSGTDRELVLEVLLVEGECHGDNHSPFYFLEDEHTKQNAGWLDRAERLRGLHEKRTELMPELPHVPVRAHLPETERTFAAVVADVLKAQENVPHVDGLVLVLAPRVLGAPRKLTAVLQRMLEAPTFAKVRFILVETGDDLAELGGVEVECIVDPEERRDEQKGALASEALVVMGGAGPKGIVPPPRKGRPPRDTPLSPALAAALGPEAALLGASGLLFQKRLRGAALASGEQRFGEAIRLLEEACQQCGDAGLTHLGCVLETLVASFWIVAGERKRAQEAFGIAAARSTSLGHRDVAVQAHLGAAAMHAQSGEHLAGVKDAMVAGRLAEETGDALNAVEAYRVAGQLALASGSESAAVEAWRLAIRAATNAPDLAPHSSAPDIARALAQVVDAAAAASLRAQAAAWEAERQKSAAPKDTL